jgi:hypothetical protein
MPPEDWINVWRARLRSGVRKESELQSAYRARAGRRRGHCSPSLISDQGVEVAVAVRARRMATRPASTPHRK